MDYQRKFIFILKSNSIFPIHNSLVLYSHKSFRGKTEMGKSQHEIHSYFLYANL